VDPSSFEVRSAGATLVGARAGDGLAALILQGGPGLSDYMPDARVRVLDGCGHFPCLEQPGVVAAAALELLPVA
jgi:pimeloyl-ACP methyl ester carboxylesterase